MRKTTYVVHNDDIYNNIGTNTALSIARITTAIGKELARNEHGYDSHIESDYRRLLEDIIALLSNYNINQFENPYGDSHEN